MPKVWAFGCSHTEGTELGINNYINVDAWLMENFGTTDYRNLDVKTKNKLMKKWHSMLDNLIQKTDIVSNGRKLSYAGQLATLLDYDLMNFAIRGSGADRAFYELVYKKSKQIDWQNDIVLVGFTHTHRFMYDVTYPDRNINLNSPKKSNKNLHKTLITEGPSDIFWSAANAGIYHLIKVHYPKVKFISTVKTTNSLNPGKFLSSIQYNDYRLDDYAISLNDVYPQGHYKEYAHKELAKHIYEKLNNENT